MLSYVARLALPSADQSTGARMSRRRFSALVLTLLMAASSRADNWPQWRGPSGQGYSDDARVPLRWGDGENLLWKTKLPGAGNSSPVVWGDRVFLTAASSDGKERYVLCVRGHDGKVLWQKTAAHDDVPEKLHAWNTYATPSCTTDGKHVYAFFGTPGLFCYDLDGRLIWKQQFGVFTTDSGWGIGASPFLFENLVIQNCDNDGAAGLRPEERGRTPAPMALIALDKATGKERWRTARDMGRGYSTPLLRTCADGRKELLLNGPRGVWAYDPKSGAEQWHCERPPSDEQSKFGEPMPVFSGDTLFALPGRQGTAQCLRLGGSGDVTGNVQWTTVRKGSRDVASPIVWDGLVYAADSNNGLLSCFDLKSGAMVYKDKQRLGATVTASPVAVRGKLLFVLESGDTVVLQPGGQFKEVGRNTLSDGTKFRASPAVADGRLYLRSQTHVYCIGEKERR
jgi:outer membrane protein assembly factor BamB